MARGVRGFWTWCCYFIAVGALEVSHLANQSDGDVRPPAVWEALVIMTNACFGGGFSCRLSSHARTLPPSARLQNYRYTLPSIGSWYLRDDLVFLDDSRRGCLFRCSVATVDVHVGCVGGNSPALLRDFASCSISMATHEARSALRTDGSTSQSRTSYAAFYRPWY
ncbi:hypothetical protein GQ600_7759 [Phytophthora cactorum]|nr:hypothetical protein GQ600_7759 [Phytophthora cactorum]